MSVTIGSFTANYLTAQPYGHDESNVYQGRTARKWIISGIFDSTEWAAFNSQYQTWRDARILDEDSVKSGAVGTTVLFSGTGFGQTWTNVPCWYLSAPQGDQLGAYVQGRAEIVDAAEKLEVILAEKESSEEEDLPDLGTINIGGAVLTLLSPPESLADLPALEPMANGNDYISGPLKPREILQVNAYGTATDWGTVYSWALSELQSTPAASDWFPISAPTATAKHKIVSGVKTVRYTINITLGKVK